MGCPDWPKCFGTWIPPTSEAELPENYEQEYLEKRKVKVTRLAALLKRMGLTQKSEALASVNGVMTSEPFNVQKTYTEYVNRLWGALTGIITLLAAISSFQYWKFKRTITLFTLLGVLFVIINGWLGSVVVDTDLLGGVVSIHFVMAFAAIASFMIAFYYNKKSEGNTTKSIKTLTIAGLILSIGQLLSGTSVRESIDQFGNSGVLIGLDNFDLLGGVFNTHRLLALFTGLLLVYVFYLNRKTTNRPRTSIILLITIGFVVLQALTGILNIRFEFPAIAQLMHVTIGSITLVSFIYLTIQELKSKNKEYGN